MKKKFIKWRLNLRWKLLVISNFKNKFVNQMKIFVSQRKKGKRYFLRQKMFIRWKMKLLKKGQCLNRVICEMLVNCNEIWKSKFRVKQNY